jgi:hypothetical protein
VVPAVTGTVNRENVPWPAASSLQALRVAVANELPVYTATTVSNLVRMLLVVSTFIVPENEGVYVTRRISTGCDSYSRRLR